MWLTISGSFKTHGIVKNKNKLTKLSSFAIINYKFHVAPTLGIYDMIIGQHFMKEIGLTIDFASKQFSGDSMT